MLTGEQIRAARAMLRISRRQLAEMTHIRPHAIRRMEGTAGELPYPREIVLAVRSALEAAGISFIDQGEYAGDGGPGVRLEGEVIAEDNVEELETVTEPDEAPEIVALSRAHSIILLSNPQK